MKYFEWQHIEYEDGSNPYICTTQKQFQKMKRKYKEHLVALKANFWMVTKENS